MSRYKALAAISLVASLILLVLPRIVPICTGLTGDGEPMRCHYAFQAEFLFALLAVIFSGSLFVLRTAEARLLAGLTLLLLGTIVVILPQPWAVGICPHPAACHKTAFFAEIGGAILAAAGALLSLLAYKAQKETKR